MQSPPGSADLPRRLGTFSLASAAVGLIIGSGIFRVPSSVAADAGSLTGVGLVWLLAGLTSLCGALALAELAALFPRTGGVYVFLREVYGPLGGFLYGWARLTVLMPTTLGAIALICAAYLRELLPFALPGDGWVAGGLIALLAAVNYRSTIWSVVLENATTVTKLGALAAVSVAIFWLGDRSTGALAPSADPGALAAQGAGLALVTAMWTYSGWATACSIVGEVRDPGRTIPRALIGGLVAVTVAYLLVNAAYLWVLPLDVVARSPAVAVTAMSEVAGAGGTRLVALLVVISTLGALNAAILLGPRVFFAMARDGLLFRRVGGVHPVHHTPHAATILSALLGVAYLSVQTFEELAQAFILGAWPFYVAAVVGVFILRRRRPDAPRPYRAWGHPWTSGLFLLVSGGMLLNSLVARPGLTLFGFGLILAGVPVYALVRRRSATTRPS